MGIGDIGWSELIFLLALALILLGPRRLPEIANALGRSLREFRRALNEVQDELRRETRISSLGDAPWNPKFDAPFGTEPRPPHAPPAPAPEPAAPEPSAAGPGPASPPPAPPPGPAKPPSGDP